MKKLFLKLLFITIIMAFGIINFYRMNVNQGQNHSIILENVKAIADSESGGYGWPCYATYNQCYVWNCVSINVCTHGCPRAKADSYFDKSRC